jgi:hypothetical protein
VNTRQLARARDFALSLLPVVVFPAATSAQPRLVPVAYGWARNSINATIFRRNSIASHDGHQVVAFYDPAGNVVLARRRLESTAWDVQTTRYTGNVKDAHNGISVMFDGSGVLHMAWDHHVSPLRYCRSLKKDSLELSDPLPLTGENEQRVTYPEFHRLPDGNLLLAYRDGASGRGNLVLKHYDTRTQRWSARHHDLVSGEGRRNPYWQMAVDARGVVHLSWVWRESPDVASNHDLGYAKSSDSGKTWQRSDGTQYALPITAESAEYAMKIPQQSELINQTSMCADAKSRPYIATYWRPVGSQVPQYMVVHHDGSAWKASQVTRRTAPFSLSGGGTKRIPISRPQILASPAGAGSRIFVIFRDEERGGRVSVAETDDPARGFTVQDLTRESLGSWEPSFDTELWARAKRLHLFVQNVGQGDGERLENLPPQPVSVLEWRP